MKTEKRAAAKTVSEKRPWRFSRPKRIIAAICAILMIVVGVIGIGAYAFVYGVVLSRHQYDDGTWNYDHVTELEGDVDDGTVDNIIENPTPVNIDSIEVRGNTDTVTNVMLLGIDGRYADGYAARSDTNMVLSVNTATKTIKLASILRDTWVTLAGRDRNGDGEDDYDKLNAAFYYGGWRMLSDTIEQNFKLDIDYYIAVDFQAFEKAVDALGGIDIELTKEEAEFIPKESDDPDRFATPDNPDLEPLGHEAGVYHLNGQQALAYSRIRTLYAFSDFQRQSNQRIVIDKLIQKAKSASFGELTNTLFAILPYVQTNMTKDQLLDYAAKAIQYSDFQIESDFSIPSLDPPDFENGWIGDGLGLWLTDAEQSTLNLHRYLYNEFTNESEGDAQ